MTRTNVVSLAGAKKHAQTTTEENKTRTRKITPKGFPKKELDEWLKSRTSWDHHEWTNLLGVLREKGYTHLTDCQEGQDKVGEYLETTRKNTLT